MSTESALELDVEAAGESRGVQVHFSNFPGLWEPGKPIAISELGFATADDAVAAVKEIGLPLQLVEVEPGSAPMPVRDNHVANEEQARAIELAASPRGFKTHAEVDAAAADADVTWPAAKMTVAAKAAFLHAVAAGETAETAETEAGEN